MKKLILIAGVFIALTAIMESCKPVYPHSGKMKRPQRHPRYPRKQAMVMPQHQVEKTVAYLG
jgi:hypothetical protein